MIASNPAQRRDFPAPEMTAHSANTCSFPFNELGDDLLMLTYYLAASKKAVMIKNQF